MTKKLPKQITNIYEKCGFKISDFQIEKESKEYAACRYTLNGFNIISRDAKITPKKGGQFVTFWKRNGTIEPFCEADAIDFLVINVYLESLFGQFVFPRTVLLQKGIISTKLKEGKRAFRVYPSWYTQLNKLATETRKWQLEYFFEFDNETNIHKYKKLHSRNF